MKVVDDEAYRRFADAAEAEGLGVRIKSVRHEPLMPGGRARVRLFGRVGSGRPHPRLQIEFPPAQDPDAPGVLFEPSTQPADASALADVVRAELDANEVVLTVGDLDPALAPKRSEKFWRNSIRAQRLAAFFEQVRDKVVAWGLGDEGMGAVRQIESETLAGKLEFDDADTGTYHSYRNDAPFVHYLEELLASLPEEGTEAMAVLRSATRESVRRQRRQLTHHLDHLMRHKYAFSVVEETNVEKTVGGLLIDRSTRNIVSEVPDSVSLAPRYELLRVEPGSETEHAGEWIYRHPKGTLHLQDGTAIEVPAADVRSAPIDETELTFKRANADARLRQGLRFDWDGNGYVRSGAVEWVSWAGHCDIKAVQEQLGITLLGMPVPNVDEFRSDTQESQRYTRDLLLEMVTSVMELGSLYHRIDGTGRLQRGVHEFGGARNDSRPDRLQFKGHGPGRSFRWPLGGRQDSFRVTSVTWPDGTAADMATVFFRRLPDLEATTFDNNPRYLRTVEGDYNIIDVSGARLEASVMVDVVDETTGYLSRDPETTVVDLAEGARGEHDGRFFLGTSVEDAQKRRLYRVYWDGTKHEIVAELFRYEQQDGKWVAVAVPGESVTLPMVTPTTVTLSREMKRDNPRQYGALLDIALREAKNICADTDEEAAVWNGAVTRLETKKVAANAEARTERWRVDIKARFGSARMEYMVKRKVDGEPIDYCPAVAAGETKDWPDFLWHDIPDVGSKGFVDGDWVVNETMLERDIVTVRPDDSVPSGFYVYDDHIKNTFELIYCGLAGYAYTIVHDNKRYGFKTEAEWEQAKGRLRTLRDDVRFEG